jgi:tetratricopeptide (TPR) repeat protein
MEKNMTKEAELAFHEVLKLNPKTTNIYNSLGILYRRNRDYPNAIQAYEKAMRVDPEDENIFFNLGRAHFEGGIMKRAKLYLQRAVEICPDFTEAALLLEIAEKILIKNT